MHINIQMKKYLVVISLAFVLIAELAFFNGCSNNPGATALPSSIPWQNVKVYTDPNSLITTQVNQSFSIVVSFPFIPVGYYWESTDPSAFSLLESKNLQPPSTTGIIPVAYLFKALKVGKFQILFATRDKSNQINEIATFNIEVNP